MEVKFKHSYKQGVDVVFKGFGTKSILERKFTALGARNISVESCKLTKTALDIKHSREVPVNVPGLLKKFLGEWNAVTQEEHWTGTAGKHYESVMTVSFKGVPVSIKGIMILAGDAKGCTNTVTLTVESGIPLIGRKLADFIGATAADEGQKEYEYLRENL